jgi:cyclophilin family peptidyl-prolyl cis-trans isomerase
MAKRRRRPRGDNDEETSTPSKSKYRPDSDLDTKSGKSRKERRAAYQRRQDLTLAVVFIVVIAGIIGGYIFFGDYFNPDDSPGSEAPKYYEPPINPNGGPEPNNDNTNYNFPTPVPEDDPSNTIVIMEIKNFGSLVIEMYDKKVPNTVDNFVKYVEDGFFDGTIFHRIVNSPDMKVDQGGGFTASGQKAATYSPIDLEIDNSLSHIDGAIAMARTSEPNSATSQFYISVGENKQLDDSYRQQFGDRGYAVFGQVIYGDQIYRDINNVELSGEKPVQDVIVQRAYIYQETPSGVPP